MGNNFVLGIGIGMITGAIIAEILSYIKKDTGKILLAFPIGGICSIITTGILFVL